MLRSRKLTAAGLELLAQVGDLHDGNKAVIEHGNSVRTVRELLASTADSGTQKLASDDRVTRFLAGSRLNESQEQASLDQ